MLVRFEFQLPVNIYQDKDTGIWVSHAPDLELYSQGTSQEEARRAIGSAVDLYIKDCARKGIILKVLGEAGISPVEEYPEVLESVTTSLQLATA